MSSRLYAHTKHEVVLANDYALRNEFEYVLDDLAAQDIDYFWTTSGHDFTGEFEIHRRDLTQYIIYLETLPQGMWIYADKASRAHVIAGLKQLLEESDPTQEWVFASLI